MRGDKRWLLLLLLLLLVSNAASAVGLNMQLQQFFYQRYAQAGLHSDGLSVQIKTPQTLWPTCVTPQFSLPGNTRMWGYISVAASCEQTRRYIQVQVQISGNYLVAARQIARGSAISPADVRVAYGRLDTLPARTLPDSQQAVAAIALRDIIPGQPLTRMMLRQPWRVKAGQTVTVHATGEGFMISSEGRAINNATLADAVRVRLNSGQIVNGHFAPDGNILISL